MYPGNKWHHSLPFSRICTASHSATSVRFNQSPQVSYTTGPANTGDPLPWGTTWAAWVGRSGVKVAKRQSVTLPDNSGTTSSLFPSDRPSKLAIGFTSIGQMAIAIQETETQIRIKWFKDPSGAVETIGNVTFQGQSPILFNNGLVHSGDDEDETDLVLYYIKVGEPRKLYARFEREHFTIERLVHNSIQVAIGSLIGSAAVSGKQLIYLRDLAGRDVTLYSKDYYVEIDDDFTTLLCSFTAGAYIAGTPIISGADGDTCTLALSFGDGSYSNPITSVDPIAELPATLLLSFTAGEYI